MERISARQYHTFERYYKLYKVLFENAQYDGMSLEAKVTYSLLRDRLELSFKNNWVDEHGDLYLIFSNGGLQKMLGCSKPKLIRIKKELSQLGLIEEVPQYSVKHGNQPNRIYLGLLSDDGQETPAKGSENSQNESYPHPGNKSLPGGAQNVTRGVTKFNPNETNINKTNNSDDISSRKAEKISDEISQPAEALDSPIRKEEKYIRPKYYSLLQLIADCYNNKFMVYRDKEGNWNEYSMTHSQKMKIGQFLETGYILSHEVEELIERIPRDCIKPFAYLMKSLENLKEERRLEAKLAAHRNAQDKYSKGVI